MSCDSVNGGSGPGLIWFGLDSTFLGSSVERFGSDWSLLVFTGSLVWISWSASVQILSAEDGPFSVFSMLACESGHGEAET